MLWETFILLLLVKHHIWCLVLYRTENWTLRHSYSYEMWCWAKIAKISWTDCVKNAELCIMKEERNIVHSLERELLLDLSHLLYVLLCKLLLKEKYKGWEDEKVDISSSWMALRKIRYRKLKNDELIALCGELWTIRKTVCPVVLPRSSVHTQ